MTKEDFNDGNGNYIAYIAESTIETSATFGSAIAKRACKSVSIGETYYFRCGVHEEGFGTWVDSDQFDEWVEEFGLAEMLKEDDIRSMMSESAEDES